MAVKLTAAIVLGVLKSMRMHSCIYAITAWQSQTVHKEHPVPVHLSVRCCPSFKAKSSLRSTLCGVQRRMGNTNTRADLLNTLTQYFFNLDPLIKLKCPMKELPRNNAHAIKYSDKLVNATCITNFNYKL